MERARVSVSLKAPKRGNAGLLREFRRGFLQTAICSARADEAKIDEIGSRLASYPHHRLKGSNRYCARVGDYRIIYAFDLETNRIHLLAVGHRREIYRL